MSREEPIYWDHIIFREEPDEHGSYIEGLDEKATPEMIKAYNSDMKEEEIARKKGVKI